MMGDVFKAIAKKMDAEHLLSLDYENRVFDVLVANTDVLNNVIGYECTSDFDKTLDDMIASICKEVG